MTTDGPASVKVTAVCLGNICRSPMAEAVLRTNLAGLPPVTVDSGGTSGWHVGDGADRRALVALGRRGYSLDHSARQVDRSWWATGSIVLAMDHANFRDLEPMVAGTGGELYLLRQFDPRFAGAFVWARPDLDEVPPVPDPYYDGSFDRVLAMVEAACTGFAQALEQRLSTGNATST